MKKLYWLFPVSLLAFLAIIFLSFREVRIFYVVEGQVVDAAEQPVFNARVALQEQEVDTIIYYEPTRPNGNFRLSFNAVEGKPLILHIQKGNFRATREIIPSSEKRYVDLVIELETDRSVTDRPIDPALARDGKVVSASVVPVK